MPEIKPPWERATKQRYQQQETRLAKKDGASPQLNSGRVWHGLRDVTLKSFLGKILFDAKTTETKSYTITKDDWKDLKRDANRTPPGCVPALHLEIKDLSLIVFEESTWEEAVQYVLMLETQIEQKDEELSEYIDKHGVLEIDIDT